MSVPIKTPASQLQLLIRQLHNTDKIINDPNHALNNSIEGLQYLHTKRQSFKRQLLLYRKPSKNLSFSDH